MIEHTVGPEVPLSGAPGAPQFRMFRAGFTAECGSSMISSASLYRPPDRSRLVMLVFNKIVKFTWGTTWPAGVGMPPVQFSVRSPTSSV